MRESKIEKALRVGVEAQGGMCIKQEWVNLRGAPDRLVLLPHKQLMVETKAPGKKPEAHQERLHKKLRALGVTVEVIDSLQQVEDLLK